MSRPGAKTDHPGAISGYLKARRKVRQNGLTLRRAKMAPKRAKLVPKVPPETPKSTPRRPENEPKSEKRPSKRVPERNPRSRREPKSFKIIGTTVEMTSAP